MGSPAKNTLGGSIHRIREFELEKVHLGDEFDILQIVGEGWFGKILLVEHKGTDTEMVLKALPKPYTALRDFYREFHYGLHLSAHKNIITTYDVAFETPGFYVFSQEYAPLGDLTSNVSETGIGELHSKRVAKQLAAALEHLHTRDLVHRDVKLDNILVFKSDFSRIKLCDFGETRKSGSLVLRRNEWLPYAPPEVLNIPNDENYKAETSHDVWQFGIVIFVCLTGCLPWQKAALDDPRYVRYLSWHSSAMPIKRQPKLFKLISSRAQRLFKKFLEPRSEKRPTGLSEVQRFLEDRWMSKGGIEKNNTDNNQDDGLCPSMYSFHSSPEEKNKLLFTLTQYGIETTVDRRAKKDRIREWIQASVIEEEEDIKTAPEENLLQTLEYDVNKTSKHDRHIPNTNKKPDIYIPPIDPRIPLELQRPKTRPTELTDNNKIPSILKSKKPESINGASKKPEVEKSVQFNTNELTSQRQSRNQNESTTGILKHGINVQIPQSQLYNDNYERQLSPSRPTRTKNKQNGHAAAVTNGIQMSSPVVTRKNSGKIKQS